MSLLPRSLSPAPERREPALPRAVRFGAAGGRVWFVAAWALLVGLLALPIAYFPPGVGLDSSWEAGLDMAIGRRLQWGPQIVFTYGPYGFLDTTIYHRFGTWLLELAAALCVHAAFVAALVAFLHRTGGGLWRYLLVGSVFLLPLVGTLTLEYECILAVVLLLFVAATTGSARAGVVLAAAAGGLLALLLTVKGTGMAAAAALVLASVAFMALCGHWRRAAVLPASTAMSFLFLWLAAGQSPLNIPVFFRASYEIISGYSAGLSVLHEYHPAYVKAQVAFGWIAIGSAILAFGWALVHRQRDVAGLLMLTIPVLFDSFKEGFVRLGGRQLVFYSITAVISAVVLACVLRRSAPPARLLVATQPAATGLVAALLVSGVSYATGATILFPATWPVSSVGDRVSTYDRAGRLIVDPAARRSATEEGRARARTAHPLSAATLAQLSGGTVDVVPWDIEAVSGYGLAWSPHPVLQSYTAYTPWLDHLDAVHFQGGDAAQHVLVAYREADGHYLPFEEPAMFRTLAGSYELASQDGEFLVLARRQKPAAERLRPIRTVQARVGDTIQVPPTPDGRVYASVQVPYSLRGRFMNLAYQPGELHVSLGLASGATVSYRFVPAVASDGLMLSTYLGSEDDLRAYFDGGLPHPIGSFRITSDGVPDYTGAVHVTFLVPA